jgi:hypothetical protein
MGGMLGSSGCTAALVTTKTALAIAENHIEEERATKAQKKSAETKKAAARAQAATPMPLSQEPGPRAEDIQAVELSTFDGRETYCQGGMPPKLRLTLTTAEGGRHESVQGGEGGELFGLFQWSASLGRISKRGRWEPPVDSLRATQRQVVITAALAAKPTVSARLTLTPEFKCERIADFRGARGKTGKSGANGAMGQDGSSSQPKGGRGGNGEAGGAGGPGGDALSVEVALAYVRHFQRGTLVLVRVQQVGGTKRAYYLLELAGAPLMVDVSGGQGGPGGWGGSGGNGGLGYSGSLGGSCCDNHGGDGGDGGPGGPGGNGGRGGGITVRFDSSYAELKEHIRLFNSPGLEGEGGSGGSPGSPGPGGQFGNSGPHGAVGQPGTAGPEPQFVPDSASSVFTERFPPELSPMP